jgi:hypothetical protein
MSLLSGKEIRNSDMKLSVAFLSTYYRFFTINLTGLWKEDEKVKMQRSNFMLYWTFIDIV